MNNGKVSVIIPVYNAVEYLHACFNSLLGQTYLSWEAIFINDGSTDGSGELLQEVSAKDSRFVVLSQENQGVSAARNRGMEAANGEYLYFFDADDRIEPELLKRMVEEAEEKQVSAVRCGYVFETETGEVILSASISNRILFGKGLTDHVESMICGIAAVDCDGLQFAVIWNTLFRREVMGDLLFDTKLFRGEDTLFIVQALLRCTRVAVISDCLYHYVKHEGSAMGRYHPNFEENTFGYLDALEEVVLKEMPERDVEKISASSLYSLVLQNLMNIMRAPDRPGRMKRRAMRRFLSLPRVAEGMKAMKVSAVGMNQKVKVFLLRRRLVWVLGILIGIRERQDV